MIQSIKNVLHNPIVWFAAIYLILPTDFIPDAVPVVGTIDDLVAYALGLVIQDYITRNKNNNY